MSTNEVLSLSCFRIASISVVISVLIQILWPLVKHYAITPQIFCTFFLTPDALKQSQYCALYLSTKRAISLRPTAVGYFVDPLSVETYSYDQFFKDYDLPPLLQEKKASEANDHTMAEAVAALHVAVESRKQGNLRRAEVIIQHAFALAPTHPDILTEYGKVLEVKGKNIVKAEELYKRALRYNPEHVDALIQRARTLPLVEEIDKEMFDNLHAKLAYFLTIPRDNLSLKRAMRESYFLHVYHTIAIEGNTMSLGQTRSILETRMAVAGKSIIEHNEILGMDAALRFINQSVIRTGSFSLQNILDIHRRILGFVDPDAAGVFRKTQVFVGNFVPVSADMVQSEMEELVRWLNDDSILMDPIERAAIAHYKLVYIHPFVDGNGRTARLLMNLILMQAGFPPIIIPVQTRAEYYEALTAANNADLRPFIRFIARQIDSTLQMYINSVSTCHYHETSGECIVPISQRISTQVEDQTQDGEIETQ